MSKVEIVLIILGFAAIFITWYKLRPPSLKQAFQDALMMHGMGISTYDDVGKVMTGGGEENCSDSVWYMLAAIEEGVRIEATKGKKNV